MNREPPSRIGSLPRPVRGSLGRNVSRGASAFLLFAFTVGPAATVLETAANAAAVREQNQASPASVMEARQDPASGQIDLSENGKSVLRYNYKTVEPGEALNQVTPANRIYARPRSDYIHPLHGLNGEVLTKDWSLDHPHHRGIYWAWPEVDYGTNRGDLHALQKVFARPTGEIRLQSGSEFAQIEAENLWLWEDHEPIVREQAIIRAYRATEQGRVIDLAFRFVALKDDVALARRGTAQYGGLNIRMATPASQAISVHTDASNAVPRRAWSDLSGVFGGSTTPSGLTVLQHRQNPDYPGDWVQYTNLSWCQPTFPAAGTRYPLRRDQPLVLRYRLIVHAGPKPEDDKLAKLWDDLHAPATALPAVAVDAPATKPNIVLILADDLGFGDMGCYGATRIPTPNVDRLAREGLRFRDAHSTSATCTPARYALLTGEYPWRKKGTGILPGDAELIIQPGRATVPRCSRRPATGPAWSASGISAWAAKAVPTGTARSSPARAKSALTTPSSWPPPATACRASMSRTSAWSAWTRRTRSRSATTSPSGPSRPARTIRNCSRCTRATATTRPSSTASAASAT